MTEREPEPLSGRFWLADAEEQKVSGRLALGSEGPRLELDGTLTPGMRLKSVATAEDGSTLSTYVPVLEEDELLTVHGEVDSGVGIEPVTLVDGITTSRTYNPLSPGAGRQRLQGLYAFRGGHVAGKDELFTKVRVRLHHLDEWASLGGFGQELEEDKASVIFEQTEVPPVPLHNGGRLDLQQVLAWRFSDVLGGGLTRTVWLRAVNLPPTRWRELDRGLVTPLSTLLTLAVDADCPPVQVEVATGPDSGWLSIHSSGLRPPPDRPVPAGQMLLPLAVLGLPGVAAWLDRVETLGPLPPVVAAAVAGPPRTVETGVLDLTTAAEGLARRLWSDWNQLTKEQAAAARKTALAAVEKQGDEVVKVVQGALQHLIEPSYPQRLLRLAERADDVVPKVVGRRTEGRPSRWKNAVAGARNDFAHSQDRGWLGEERLDEYLAVIGSLRWLLTAVLLLETGLPADTLAARFARHQRYLLFLRQAREWHPDVYVQLAPH